MGRNAIEYYDGDQALEFFKKSLVIDPTNKYSMTVLLACNPHRLKEVDIEWRRKKIVYAETGKVFPKRDNVSVTCLLPIGRAASIFPAFIS